MFHHSEETDLVVQLAVLVEILLMLHLQRGPHLLLGLAFIPRLLLIGGLVQCLNLQLVLSGHRIGSDHRLEINQNKTQLLLSQKLLFNNLPPGDVLMLLTIQRHLILQIVSIPQVEGLETLLSLQVYMGAIRLQARQLIELDESLLLWDLLLRIAEATREVVLQCKTPQVWEVLASQA
jgi:hypothetical protein